MPKSKSPKSKGKGDKKKPGGGKGKGKSKSKKKGGKKKAKKEVTPVEIPIPEPDVYFWVRRKTTSVLIETFEEQSLPDFKTMLSGILGSAVDTFTLFKDKVELVDVKKVKSQKNKESGRGGFSGGAKKESAKSKTKGKGKKGDDSAGKESSEPPPLIMRLVDYGINVTSSPIFSPMTLGLAMRDENGILEPVEITPWTKPAEIPESVKPYLRNYAGVLGAANVVSTSEDATSPDAASIKSGTSNRNNKKKS